MPTYDYICPNGHRFEVIHSISGVAPEACPICGASPVRKGFSAPSVHFKGTGWAKKDRSSTSRAPADASTSAEADGSSSTASSTSTGGSEAGSGGSEAGSGGSDASGDEKATPAKPAADAKGGGAAKTPGSGSAAAD